MGSGIRNRGGVVTLKGVIERRKAGGGVLRYLRVRQAIVAKLPDDIPMDSPAFLAAYAAAREAHTPVKNDPGTLAHLIEVALRSDRVKGWSPSHRRAIRRDLDAIRAAYGKLPARGAQDRHIQADVDKAPNPRARMKAWRFLTDHGCRTGILTRDPAKGLTVERKATDGYPPWTEAEIAAFRARWPIGSVARAAMELLFWTGCRVSDAVLIGPQHVGRDGVLAFRQTKTKGFAFVPWTCAVPPFADAADRDQMHQALGALPGGHMTFLATAQGNTRSVAALSHLIRASAHEAGIERSAHGLRKARLTALAEGGATTHQIGAWGGHESLKEVEHYTRSASRRAAVMGTEQARNDGNASAPQWKNAKK